MEQVGPHTILIVPHGTGIGDLAPERGLIPAVMRRWPAAAVSVFASAARRWLEPDGARVEARVRGSPREGAWSAPNGPTRRAGAE